MSFEIYVKTSPLGKQIGIHWRKIEGDQNREEPKLITKKINTEDKRSIVNDLIYPQKPSLLIFRGESKLLLELTGIECLELAKKSDRQVLTSIVWIAEDSPENEKIIRTIAVDAIKNILSDTHPLWNKIEESISFHGAEEFRVKRETIDSYIDQIVEDYSLDYLETDKKYLIEKRNNNLNGLAEELKSSKLPQEWICWDEETPRKDGVIVAFTEYLERPTILHQAGVWRGYAYNVKEPEKKPISELPIPQEPPKILKKQTTKKTPPSKLLMIEIAAAILLAILLFFL